MALLSCIGSFGLGELIVGVLDYCALPIGVLGISIVAAITIMSQHTG